MALKNFGDFLLKQVANTGQDYIIGYNNGVEYRFPIDLFVSSGISGLNQTLADALYYPLEDNPSGYVQDSETGNFVLDSETGDFATTGYVQGELSNYVGASETGDFVTSSETGNFITETDTGIFLNIHLPHVNSAGGAGSGNFNYNMSAYRSVTWDLSSGELLNVTVQNKAVGDLNLLVKKGAGPADINFTDSVKWPSAVEPDFSGMATGTAALYRFYCDGVDLYGEASLEMS